MSTKKSQQSEPKHRDKEILRDAWERHDSVSAVARELGCSPSTASKWLDRHGIREKGEGSLHHKIHFGTIDVEEIDSFDELAELLEEHK